VLALDTSDSLKTNDPHHLFPTAAALMVHLLEERDSFGLLRFDATPSVVLEPGPLTRSRRQRALRELEHLGPRGPYTDVSALLDAGLEVFEAPTASRRALVLITGGELDIDPRKGDAASQDQRLKQTTVPAYQRADIAIYTVAVAPKADQKLLKELAAATGGVFLLAEKASDLHKALVRIYEDLKQPQLAPLIHNRFCIDAGVGEAVLIATREASGRPVGLTDPHGRQLTPKDSPRQVRWFATPAFDLVTIPRPRPGFWKLSGSKEGEGKIALLTDRKLVCPHVPAEVGGDEELTLGAMIFEGDRTLTQEAFLKQAVFQAGLTPEGGEAIRVELGTPPADQREAWPSGPSVGRFPPLRTPGTARVQVQVLGKTFQRERNFSVRVAVPWYRQEVAGTPDHDPGQIKFLPTAKGPPGEVQGWLSVQSAIGGLAAALFKPPTSGAFSLALPAWGARPQRMDLLLTGVTSSGRPLAIRPAFSPLEPEIPHDGTASEAQGFKVRIVQKIRDLARSWRHAAASLKARKSWLLAALGVWFAVMASGALWLVQGRCPLAFLSKLTSRLPKAGGAPQQTKLLLMVRIETLEKEKMALQGELDQLAANLRQAAEEKEELRQSMEEQSLKFRNKTKIIGELEQKLQEAESGAKSMQQEYMALYARSQGEKKIIEKN
jgi:von Willebrand factor type A domain